MPFRVNKVPIWGKRYPTEMGKLFTLKGIIIIAIPKTLILQMRTTLCNDTYFLLHS